MRFKSIGLLVLIITLMSILAGCSKEEPEQIEAYNIISCKLLKASADNWNAASGTSFVCGMYGDGVVVESLGLELRNPIKPGNLEYQGHVQSLGWTDWLSGGDMVGDAGSGKRIEAVKLRLTGKMAETYDIYYRVYVSSMSWTKWTANGDIAGTTGLSKGIESIEIKLIPKVGLAPEDGATYDASEAVTIIPELDYSIFLKGTGWIAYDGECAGIPGNGGRAEGFKINLVDSIYKGSVTYRTYAETYGWLNWVKAGELSGTSTVSKRAEGIQIKLTGEIAEQLDICYRVCVQDYGWLGWAVNGQSAGTKDMALQLEAIEIILLPKGEMPPGETVRAGISPYSDTGVDIGTVLNKERERMIAVGKYYVEDTEDFKKYVVDKGINAAEGISRSEVRRYCDTYFSSDVIEINVSIADGDVNDYCVQEILKYYIGKGDKVVFYTEFAGYTMDDSLMFKCYYSRS